MADTAIEWAEAVWNPTTGCDRVSPGCDNCYALTMAKRLKAMGQAKYQTDGDPRTSGPGFGLAMHEDVLTVPLRWREPKRIFVNSMSDLFHDKVPDEFIARVFAVMAATPQHTFQVLTKRHGRMRSLLNRKAFRTMVQRAALQCVGGTAPWLVEPWWPLRNVWLGVSAENQRWANLRIPALLDTPAAVRWISAEPLLGPIDMHAKDTRTFGPQWLPAMAYCVNAPNQRAGDGSSIGDLYKAMYGPNLDWVVIGGESGPGSRPFDPDWARSIVEQCQALGVAPFVKQMGSVWARSTAGLLPVDERPDPKGGNWDHWPADLRVREYPTAVTA